jgi:hypothetical protein
MLVAVIDDRVRVNLVADELEIHPARVKLFLLRLGCLLALGPGGLDAKRVSDVSE